MHSLYIPFYTPSAGRKRGAPREGEGVVPRFTGLTQVGEEAEEPSQGPYAHQVRISTRHSLV